MKILAVGGGSGGHVTPVVAVIKEIRKTNQAAEIQFWCDKKFGAQAKSIIGSYDKNIQVDTIFSGKFRRYHSLSIWKQLTRFSDIVWPNIKDGFLVTIGLIQSFIKLLIWRPDVVFVKGGFVGVPVGLAAHLLRIPIVIHDSDAHPGLANRIVSRWAKTIATGAPLKHYRYPKSKSVYVGTPVDETFTSYLASRKSADKVALGFTNDKPLVVVTGGGLGAHRINQGILKAADLIQEFANIYLITGKDQFKSKSYQTYQGENFKIVPFVSDGMAKVMGAADLVISRAGATSILELAALAKPTILVPNKFLTGGHQLKNATVYEEANAVVIANEDEFDEANYLSDMIRGILNDNSKLAELSENFSKFAKPDAARDMAKIIVDAAA